MKNKEHLNKEGLSQIIDWSDELKLKKRVLI